MNSQEINELREYADNYGISIVSCENYNGTLEAHYVVCHSFKVSEYITLEEAKSMVKSVVNIFPIGKILSEPAQALIEVVKHKNIIDFEIMKLRALKEKDEEYLQELIRKV